MDLTAFAFALQHDDAQEPSGLFLADVVVVGISRTGKTPLCLYLASMGLRAANVPLVPGIDEPAELYKVDRQKIVGLTLRPERLMQLRCERLKTMGKGAPAGYASLENIVSELEYAELIIRQLGCCRIDSSDMSVEEIAFQILKGFPAIFINHASKE